MSTMMLAETVVENRCNTFGLAVAGLTAFALSCAGPVTAQNSAEAHPTRSIGDETSAKIDGSLTVAAVGDIIMPKPLRRSDPRVEALMTPLREADVAFANMESSIVDWREFEGPVAGTVAPLETGAAIRAMGIDLMSRANNHAWDGGREGMVSTDRALEELGIAHAGTGLNLQEARAAGFLETLRGRVGLVSMFSVEDVGAFGPTYARTEATMLNGRLGGAPGVNPLHLTTYHVVSAEQLEALRETARAVYGERPAASATSPSGAARFRFFDEWYEAGPDVGALRYDMHPGDRREIIDSIRSGKVAADFLIATIHAHQTPVYCGVCAFGNLGTGMKEGVDHYPADFLVTLAHEAIDNGADMFVVHGVHALAGIEIYQGRPIFYGLSNFVFQFGLQPGASYDTLANETRMAALEHPATQEAVLTLSRFEDGRLAEIRLYPADLGGARRPISQMGIPMTPSDADAERILTDLQTWSEGFGTRIRIEDGVGIITLN